ncbi:MAG: hypothetical protein ACRDOJ_12545 [Nocardioidaceae bacterium]
MAATIPKPLARPVASEEQPTWAELWDDCAVIMGRYPRLTAVAATTRPDAVPPAHEPVIPAAAVEAADVHFHLD